MSEIVTEAYRYDGITPRWIIWTERAFRCVWWVLTRGGLMATGGVILWCGYMWGQEVGVDRGFAEGCRIGASQERCDRAVEFGTAIRQARTPFRPGEDAKKAEQEQTWMRLCRELSEGDHGQAFAGHYGCH